MTSAIALMHQETMAQRRRGFGLGAVCTFAGSRVLRDRAHKTLVRCAAAADAIPVPSLPNAMMSLLRPVEVR